MDRIIQLLVAYWEEGKASPILLLLLFSSPSLSRSQVFICSLVIRQGPSTSDSWQHLHKGKLQVMFWRSYNLKSYSIVEVSLMNDVLDVTHHAQWGWSQQWWHFESLGLPAQNIDVHMGMCPSLPKWIHSKFNTAERKLLWISKEERASGEVLLKLSTLAKLKCGLLTALSCEVTHPSGCCKAFFMALICWKWQDISVANTISMTRALNSLSDSITMRAARKEKHKNQHQTHSRVFCCLSANYWQQCLCM